MENQREGEGREAKHDQQQAGHGAVGRAAGQSETMEPQTIRHVVDDQKAQQGEAGNEERAAIRDALAGLSFDSVRGPFKFDAKGDPLLVTHVVKIVDGKETNARDTPVQK